MTNEQIIADAAISAGLYTADEIERFRKDGKVIPIHTLKGWTSRGNYKIKKGEKGLHVRLWKKKDKSGAGDEKSVESNKGFYLTKAVLFTEDQVELQEVEE